RLLATVDVAHECLDAGVEEEVLLVAVTAEVDELNPDALGEVGLLAEAGGEGVELVVEGLEDVRVGHPADAGAGGFRFGAAHLLDLPDRVAVVVGLAVERAVARDLSRELGGEGVHAGRADAVQAAGDLVPATAELAAGVEHGEDGLDAGAA